MANLISRYETVQFSDLYHFVRFWHEAMGHADIKTMLLIATRIIVGLVSPDRLSRLAWMEARAVGPGTVSQRSWFFNVRKSE